MNRKINYWGQISLAVESLSFGLYILSFLIWRFDLLHLPLLSFSGFLPKLCVRLVLLAALFAVVGLVRDVNKMKAIIVLALIFPVLAIMGVLNGNW